MKRLIGLLVLASISTAVVFAQPSVRRTRYRNYPGITGAGWHVSGLLGAYVKDITEAGVVTLQLADGTEDTRTLLLGGGGGLTTEQVQALVGGMVTGNTETNITVTYNSGTQKLDFVVDLSGVTQRLDTMDVLNTAQDRNLADLISTEVVLKVERYYAHHGVTYPALSQFLYDSATDTITTTNTLWSTTRNDLFVDIVAVRQDHQFDDYELKMVRGPLEDRVRFEASGSSFDNLDYIYLDPSISIINRPSGNTRGVLLRALGSYLGQHSTGTTYGYGDSTLFQSNLWECNDPTLCNAQVPPSENEGSGWVLVQGVTEARVRSALSLTEEELNNLIVNVNVSGENLTLTENDGGTTVFSATGAGNVPEATESVSGTVRGISTTEIDSDSGTAFRGWTVNRIRRAIRRLVEDWAESDSTDNIPAVRLPTATFVSQGIVEFATNSETESGTSITRATTPSGVAQAISRIAGIYRGDHSFGSLYRTGDRVTFPVGTSRLFVALDSDTATVNTPSQDPSSGWAETGKRFDLHDDVTTQISSLSASDRFLVSNEGVSGDPNQYVNLTSLQSALVSGAYLRAQLGLTLTEANNIFVDASQSGNTVTFTQNDGGAFTFNLSGGGGGSSTFTGLSDTPDALGQGGQSVIVNADRSALEFSSIPGLPPGGLLGQALQRTADNYEWGVRFYTEDSSGDLPSLVVGDIGNTIGVRYDGLFHVEGHSYPGTEPVGTWGAVGGNINSTGTDRVSSIKSGFLGAYHNIAQGISAMLANEGEFVLDIDTRLFYVSVPNPLSPSFRIWRQRNDPSDWRGFRTRNQLLHHATAASDWGFNEDNSTVEYLVTFTAGSGAHVEPFWATGLTAAGARAAAIHDLTDIEDDIPEGERSKILMERGSGNAAPTAAGIAFGTDPHIWRFTPSHGHNGAGTTIGEYGTLTPIHNVQRIVQDPGAGLPGKGKIQVRVSSNGRIPREDHLCIYFRQHDTTGNWRSVFLENGQDGTYESSSLPSYYFGDRSGTAQDVIFRPHSCSNTTVSTVPDSGRIESYADGIKLGQFVIDTDLGHVDEVVRHDPRIPNPGTSDNEKVLGVVSGEFALVDDQTSTASGIQVRSGSTILTDNLEILRFTAGISCTEGDPDDLYCSTPLDLLSQSDVEDFALTVFDADVPLSKLPSAVTLDSEVSGALLGATGFTHNDYFRTTFSRFGGGSLNVDVPSATFGAAGVVRGIGTANIDNNEDTDVFKAWSIDRFIRMTHRLIPEWARSADTLSKVPDDRLSVLITRDTELNDLFDSVFVTPTSLGTVLSLGQRDGGTSSVTIPFGNGGGGSADGVVDSFTAAHQDGLLYFTLGRTLGLDELTGNVTLPTATSTNPGLVEFATNAEASGGTLTTRAVTPANLVPLFGLFVNNAALNISNPLSENTGIAPSRRAVASAISNIQPGSSSDFNLHDDVTTQIPVISLLDRWVVSAEGISGDPNRYATSEMMRNYFTSAAIVRERLSLTETEANNIFVEANQSGDTVTFIQNDGGTFEFDTGGGGGGGGSFDLHEDVPGNNTAIASADRIVFSNEGTGGDPNAWASFATVFDGIRDVVTANNSVPEGADRIFLSDENENGDPLEWTTVDQLGDVIGGVNVAANPAVDDDDPEVDSLTIGTTDYRVAHPHRGPYNDTRDYRIGDIVSTGSGDEEIFWIASGSIDAGQGAPTQDNIGLWWSLASHGFYRGIVDDALTYHMYPGDTWIFGDHFYLSLLEQTAITGNALSTSENGVLNISEKLRVLVGQSRPPGWLDTHTRLSFDGTGITTSVVNGVPTARFGVPWLQGEENDGEIDEITTAGGTHKILLSEPGGGMKPIS